MVAWLLRDAAKGLDYLLRVKEITRSPTTPQRGGGGMLIFHPSSRERERDETRRSVKCACHLVPLLATLATSVAGRELCSSPDQEGKLSSALSQPPDLGPSCSCFLNCEMILLHEVTETTTRWDRIWRVRGRNSDLPPGLLSSHVVVTADIFSTLQSCFFEGGGI